jgi:hypothetical protein
VHPVWVLLETWLIGDGQFPELGVGGVVDDCGLRLNCSYLDESDQTVEEVRAARVDGVGRVRYELTGRCQSVTPPMAVLMAMPGWLAMVEPEAHRAVAGARDVSALERWSEQFHAPAPNQMVEAEGWLDVVADHEWDAFALPDSRMSWRLHEIHLLEHRMVRVPGEASGARTCGAVVRTTRVDRLSRRRGPGSAVPRGPGSRVTPSAAVPRTAQG